MSEEETTTNTAQIEELKTMIEELNTTIKENNELVISEQVKELNTKLEQCNEDFAEVLINENSGLDDHLVEVISNIEGYKMMVEDAE
jgi:outer membrane murein-binding lipoprotein Lpp